MLVKGGPGHLFPTVNLSWYLFQSQRHCKCLHTVYIIEHGVWNCFFIAISLASFSMTNWSLQVQVTSLKPVLSAICLPNVTRVHIPKRFEHRPSRYDMIWFRYDLNGGFPTCLWYDSLYIRIIWLLLCFWNLCKPDTVPVSIYVE